MRGFLEGLSLTGWLLVGLLVFMYVLVSLAAVAFPMIDTPGLEPAPARGRHRKDGHRPPLPRLPPVVPPPAPQWLGSDESQGWWIWRDEQGKV